MIELTDQSPTNTYEAPIIYPILYQMIEEDMQVRDGMYNGGCKFFASSRTKRWSLDSGLTCDLL